MRYSFLILATILFFTACKKDKYTTAPQITFKSIKPNNYTGVLTTTTPLALVPIITFSVTDLEGDLGFKDGFDSSYIYIKNLRTNKFDSAKFPSLASVSQKNFIANVELNMQQFTDVPNRAKKDTIIFEIYIKDFAKNKSNVIKSDPLYYTP
jgi:hypothetical protein